MRVLCSRHNCPDSALGGRSPKAGNRATERTEDRARSGCLCADVHSSVIRDGQEMAAAHVSVHRRMGRQNVVYPYSVMLFSLTETQGRKGIEKKTGERDVLEFS